MRMGERCLVLLCGLALMAATLCVADDKDTSHLNPEQIFLLPGQAEILVLGWFPDFPAGLAQDAEKALRSAIKAWNAALGGRAALKLQPAGSPPPKGRLFISVETSSDSSLFKASGRELAYTTLYAVKSKETAQIRIQVNAAAASELSGDGRADAYDLEIIFLHEIGHALGIGHASADYPPIMCAALGTNAQLRQKTQQDVPALRRLCKEDVSLLAKALERQDAYSFAGTYEGVLDYNYNITQRKMEIRGLRITQNLTEVVLEVSGNKARAHAGIHLYFLEDGRLRLLGDPEGWLNSVTIKRVADGLEVMEYNRKLSETTYVAKGFLKKIDTAKVGGESLTESSPGAIIAGR